MRLADFYLSQPGFVLLAIEHLGPGGMSDELADLLTTRADWSRDRIDLTAESLRLYWARATDLADRTVTWPRPRIRNIGVVTDATRVRPYVQILNTSTWQLYASDLDPDVSHPEFVAYLLALGDWMAATGEVTEGPVRSAAWWFGRDDAECEAFADAAKRCTRPDAAALHAVADSIDWLRTFKHKKLRPARKGFKHQEIPGTGLLVPAALHDKPQLLVDACRKGAVDAIREFRGAWQGTGGEDVSADAARAVASLLDWLRSERPRVAVTGRGGLLWAAADADSVAVLEHALAGADRVAVETIHDQLGVVARKTSEVLAALHDAGALPEPGGDYTETGYTYMHPTRGCLAYNLDEAGMERLFGPPLPYEGAMVAARSVHEWAHLIDEAGWVPAVVDEEELARRRSALASALDDTVSGCPRAAADAAASDLAEITRGASAGESLAGLLLTRLPDYRANLVMRHFLDETERETYVRHNIRTLRFEYTRSKLWRMLVRYLYEYQYLGRALGLTALSATDDPYGYFASSTAFEADFVDCGLLSAERFAELAGAVADVCGAYAVDTGKITLPGGG